MRMELNLAKTVLPFVVRFNWQIWRLTWATVAVLGTLSPIKYAEFSLMFHMEKSIAHAAHDK